eukprot:867396-Rhodomonas_salina.2
MTWHCPTGISRPCLGSACVTGVAWRRKRGRNREEVGPGRTGDVTTASESVARAEATAHPQTDRPTNPEACCARSHLRPFPSHPPPFLPSCLRPSPPASSRLPPSFSDRSTRAPAASRCHRTLRQDRERCRRCTEIQDVGPYSSVSRRDAGMISSQNRCESPAYVRTQRPNSISAATQPCVSTPCRT